MDFGFSDTEEAFRTELRAWLSAQVEPGWRTRFGALDDRLAAYLRDWDRVTYAAGWAAIWWPPEFGGRGATATEAAIFAEECAHADAPEGLARLGKRLAGPVLMQFGTADQREHLPRILRGEEVWCQGFSEPNAGSDLASLTTRAAFERGRWRIEGQKVWTSFAQYADYCLLLARTGAPGSGGDGLSVFIVDMRLNGISVSPIKTVHGSSEFNEVIFEAVELPADALVGTLHAGWRIVGSVLLCERGADTCLQRFADIRRIFEQYVRVQRTSRTPDLACHSVGQRYARVFAIELAAFELLSHEVAGTTTPALNSVVKLHTTETWRDFGIQQLGELSPPMWEAMGDTMLHDYLESLHYTISAGTSEMQRNTIARDALRLPSSKGRRG